MLLGTDPILVIANELSLVDTSWRGGIIRIPYPKLHLTITGQFRLVKTLSTANIRKTGGTVMEKKPFDKVAKLSVQAIIIALVGFIGGGFFNLLLFAIPKSWTLWYRIVQALGLILFLAFLLFTEIFIILTITALVGNFIYRITHR